MVYAQYFFDSSRYPDTNSPLFLTPRNPHVAKFKLLSCSIPMSFYTTGRQNNVVAIREDGVVRRVTIPEGNYNSATFSPTLQTALGNGYTVTYDEIQRNFRIEHPSITFSILGLDCGTTAYEALGMRREGESFVGLSYQGGISNFTGTNSLLLVSSELITRDVLLAGNEGISCLALVELDGQPGSMVRYENVGGWVESGHSMSYLRFRWLDSKTMNEIDFRGAGWTIQLGILTDDDDVVSY